VLGSEGAGELDGVRVVDATKLGVDSGVGRSGMSICRLRGTGRREPVALVRVWAGGARQGPVDERHGPRRREEGGEARVLAGTENCREIVM
jgi:hypothetical protein